MNTNSKNLDELATEAHRASQDAQQRERAGAEALAQLDQLIADIERDEREAAERDRLDEIIMRGVAAATGAEARPN